MTASKGIGRGGLTDGLKLPQVTCPATVGKTCGGKRVAADVLVHAINKGKVRDHKVANLKEKKKTGDRVHDLVLCPGSGRIVTLDPDADTQLEIDFTPVPLIPAQRIEEPTLLTAVNEQAVEE